MKMYDMTDLIDTMNIITFGIYLVKFGIYWLLEIRNVYLF